jgi:hypothetical protein
MTPEMLDKSRATATALGFRQVDFVDGLAEARFLSVTAGRMS